MRNDAQINLLNSITLAGHFVIPEVISKIVNYHRFLLFLEVKDIEETDVEI